MRRKIDKKRVRKSQKSPGLTTDDVNTRWLHNKQMFTTLNDRTCHNQQCVIALLILGGTFKFQIQGRTTKLCEPVVNNKRLLHIHDSSRAAGRLQRMKIMTKQLKK